MGIRVGERKRECYQNERDAIKINKALRTYWGYKVFEKLSNKTVSKI